MLILTEISRTSIFMKVQNFREMSPEELGDKLEEMQRRLFYLASQAVTETLENSKAMRNLKRDIARLKTVIREQQLKVKQ